MDRKRIEDDGKAEDDHANVDDDPVEMFFSRPAHEKESEREEERSRYHED